MLSRKPIFPNVLEMNFQAGEVLGCCVYLVFDGSEALLAKLGRHKTGKSCLYLKSLADVDPRVLAEMIARSVAARESQRVR